MNCTAFCAHDSAYFFVNKQAFAVLFLQKFFFILKLHTNTLQQLRLALWSNKLNKINIRKLNLGYWYEHIPQATECDFLARNIKENLRSTFL